MLGRRETPLALGSQLFWGSTPEPLPVWKIKGIVWENDTLKKPTKSGKSSMNQLQHESPFVESMWIPPDHPAIGNRPKLDHGKMGSVWIFHF